jgi:hypothetical protein
MRTYIKEEEGPLEVEGIFSSSVLIGTGTWAFWARVSPAPCQLLLLQAPLYWDARDRQPIRPVAFKQKFDAHSLADSLIFLPVIWLRLVYILESDLGEKLLE